MSKPPGDGAGFYLEQRLNTYLVLCNVFLPVSSAYLSPKHHVHSLCTILLFSSLVRARLLLQAAKTAELRIAMRFQPAGSNGVGDKSPPQREDTKKPSPPSSSSGKRASLGSAFVLLGVKKPKPAGPEPRLSTKTATAAGKGKKGSIPPPPRLSSGGGGEADGASDHPPPERLGREGKARGKQTRQHQDGLVEKKLAEQAAKMAERRKRCVGRAHMRGGWKC